MVRSKLFVALLILIGVCTLAATSFAKTPKPKCEVGGNYSFFFWDTYDETIAGVGYVSVTVDPATGCRSGVVLPGGIIDCNVDGDEYEDFIEGGGIFLETDGEGTVLIETNSSDGICDSGDDAIELDVSVVSGGKKVLFNTNGVEYAQSGTVAQAGYEEYFTGRAERCYAGGPSGSYNIRFWEPDGDIVGSCTIVMGGGYVTGGTCSCNSDDTEYLSEIVTGFYTPGEGCESSTGLISFDVSSEGVCGSSTDYFTVYLDYAAAENGAEIMGACDSFNEFDCAFEGWLQ